jgi:hypothetical protein
MVLAHRQHHQNEEGRINQSINLHLRPADIKKEFSRMKEN